VERANHRDSLTGGAFAGIIAQTPAGALADRVRSKRALVACGVIALAVGALMIAAHPPLAGDGGSDTHWRELERVWSDGGSHCARLVGRELFDRRQGRNQTIQLRGQCRGSGIDGADRLQNYLSNRGIFLFVVAFTIPTLWALATISSGPKLTYDSGHADWTLEIRGPLPRVLSHC